MAVWIGGVLAAFYLARRGMLDGADDLPLAVGDMSPAGFSVDDPDPGPRARAREYARLLRGRGYTSLKIDVLAGASAGGLNAVVYGYAQSTGVDIEWLEDVWKRQGELWKLFHPSWSPKQPFRTEALLRGDGTPGFHGVLRSETCR